MGPFGANAKDLESLTAALDNPNDGCRTVKLSTEPIKNTIQQTSIARNGGMVIVMVAFSQQRTKKQAHETRLFWRMKAKDSLANLLTRIPFNVDVSPTDTVDGSHCFDDCHHSSGVCSVRLHNTLTMMCRIAILVPVCLLLCGLQASLGFAFGTRRSHAASLLLLSATNGEQDVDFDDVGFVLLAGGTGSRMKATMPKQFLPLQGVPVLHHSLNLFLERLPAQQGMRYVCLE